jgi:phosphatidate phosphatase APP1
MNKVLGIIAIAIAAVAGEILIDKLIEEPCRKAHERTVKQILEAYPERKFIVLGGKDEKGN